MENKIHVFWGALFVGLLLHSNVQSMSLGYSYIQNVINSKQSIIPIDSVELEVFPELPSRINILRDEFVLEGLYGTIFQDDCGAIITNVRHGLYIFKMTEDTLIRVLISVKLVYCAESAYYTLNIDKCRAGMILHSAIILPKKLVMHRVFGKIILPVEEIVEQLVEIVAEFKSDI